MTKTNLLENLINITRYIPFINSFMCVLYSVLEYFSIHIHILNILIGMSFIYIYVLYILSYLLHFCWKHRLAIHFLSILLREEKRHRVMEFWLGHHHWCFVVNIGKWHLVGWHYSWAVWLFSGILVCRHRQSVRCTPLFPALPTLLPETPDSRIIIEEDGIKNEIPAEAGIWR